MPREIHPMLATLVEEAFDDPQWLYEVKWDGYRAVAFIHEGKARMVSRNQNDLTGEFTEIAQAMESLAVENAILDGEVVALDEEGRPSFSLMQQRTGMTQPGARTSRNRAVPIVYYAFDLLHLDGYNLMAAELEQRKEFSSRSFPPTRALFATPIIILSMGRSSTRRRAIRGWKGSWPSCAPARTRRSARAIG
jgi:bifunctional non-homologous end joining protein LigD